jgi:probable phosphoglycerate mutase
VLGGLVAEQDCDLCELHPGEADGMTWLDWLERYDFDPRAEVERELAPGGESMLSFARRARDAIERVVDEHAGRSIVLVVHGGFIVASTLHFLGFDESVLQGDRALWLEPDNTSLTEWRRDDATGRWTLLRFNDAAHLEALG